MGPRSSTSKIHSSTGNTKQFERICLACNKIGPCNFNVFSEGYLGAFELESARDWLMDAANAISETNTVDLLAENRKITI